MWLTLWVCFNPNHNLFINQISQAFLGLVQLKLHDVKAAFLKNHSVFLGFSSALNLVTCMYGSTFAGNYGVGQICVKLVWTGQHLMVRSSQFYLYSPKLQSHTHAQWAFVALT